MALLVKKGNGVALLVKKGNGVALLVKKGNRSALLVKKDDKPTKSLEFDKSFCWLLTSDSGLV